MSCTYGRDFILFIIVESRFIIGVDINPCPKNEGTDDDRVPLLPVLAVLLPCDRKLDTTSTLGASLLNAPSTKLCNPAIRPFRETIRLLPTKTNNMVKADLSFLSNKALNDSLTKYFIFI